MARSSGTIRTTAQARSVWHIRCAYAAHKSILAQGRKLCAEANAARAAKYAAKLTATGVYPPAQPVDHAPDLDRD